MPQTTAQTTAHDLMTPEVEALLNALCERFGERRLDVLRRMELRNTELRDGQVARMEETAQVRESDWQVDPVPAELLERRVELIGGCERRELIGGMNAGAKSYVADLCNMTAGDGTAILRAHKNIERACGNRLAFVDGDGGRMRINPHSTTRLIVVPRTLAAMDEGPHMQGRSVPASFLDLALHTVHNAAKLRLRQGGVYFYLRETGGHWGARLWNDLLSFTEEHLKLPQGTFRATVFMDSLASVLEADEVLFELKHRSAGLSLDHQAFAADLIALFSAPDRPCFPDRAHIGLNAPFLRSVSLLTISVCHRRQAHAIGAPSFVLPAEPDLPSRPAYLEMIADKEREAVDGHDGTLVAHAGLVNPAMAEFNKSMPRSHQMYYQRADRSKPADFIQRPEGPLCTDGLLGSIRTVLHFMVGRANGEGTVVQGGRSHDLSSARLSALLLWQWAQADRSCITETGLELHADMMKYLVRKEGAKLFGKSDEKTRGQGQAAVERLTGIILSSEVPTDLF